MLAKAEAAPPPEFSDPWPHPPSLSPFSDEDKRKNTAGPATKPKLLRLITLKRSRSIRIGTHLPAPIGTLVFSPLGINRFFQTCLNSQTQVASAAVPSSSKEIDLADAADSEKTLGRSRRLSKVSTCKSLNAV